MSNDASLSVNLNLKDGLSAPLAGAIGKVGKLGDSFRLVEKSGVQALGKLEGASARLNRTVTSTGASFGAMDAGMTKALAKTANLTNRLIGITVAMQNLGGRDGVMKAVTDGFSTFSAIALMAPGPIGLVGGAIAGLAVGFRSLKEEEKEAADNLRHFKAKMEEARKATHEMRGAFAAGIMTSKNPELSATETGIENIKAALGHQLALLEQAKLAMDKNAARPLSEQFLAAKDSAEEAQANIETLKRKLSELNDEAARLRVAEKLGELNAESDITSEKVLANIITPVQAAQERLTALEGAMESLIRVQGQMAPEEFAGKMDDLAGRAAQQKMLLDQAKEDQRRDQKQKDEEQRRKERDDLRRLENSWGGVTMAADEYVNSLKTVKAFSLDVMQGMESALTNFFNSAMSGGRKFKDMFKSLAADLRKSLTQTISQALSQQVMGGLIGGFGGLLGMGGTASAVPTVNSGGGGGGNITTTALGGLGSFGGASPYIGAGLGAAAGGAIAYGGMRSGSMGQTVGGMAMAGASLGAIAGPIGAVVGLAVGAIAGAIMGGRAKRKAKRKKRAAEAAARALAAAQEAEAARLLQMDVETKIGGGLGTEATMDDAGKLLSGGISAPEMEQFGGVQAILSRRQNIEAAAANKAGNTTNVSVGAPQITVHASVSGDYDVRRLAEQLGYFLDGSIRSAAAGAGPGV